MSARVLVTGGAGYLGSVLCEHLLSAGYEVTVLDNLTHRQPSLFHLCANRAFAFQFGDARDETLLRRLVAGADVLIPLAAVVGAPACDRDPWLARALNVDAVRLLNRLRSPNQLIVYPTTNSGYGMKPGAAYCTEETALEPVSLYGRTKAQAEAELLDSPNAISLRLATVFGMSPRMRIDLLVNHFVYAAVKDRYLVIFEKHFRRNFVHIRDVADCMIHCIRQARAMAGRCYNVGLDSANLTKEQLALKVREQVPDFRVEFASAGHDPDRRDYIVSNQRLRAAGFEARRSIEEGIMELRKGYAMLAWGSFQNV
jgi:nucleoside-diphosphate-sugar epimerase